MPKRVPTKADSEIAACINSRRSFALIAGAGSGKTTSLVEALELIREGYGASLRKYGQRVACVTFTNRAVEVIKERLGADDLYSVSTLHGFLWGEISRFQSDIRQALRHRRIPDLIAKAKAGDNGGQSRAAIRARNRVAQLEMELEGIEDVEKFTYSDSVYSDYAKGRLSHDDIIEVSGYLLAERPVLRRLLGARYPYIFVDEAQDTFSSIVAGLNMTCAGGDLPLVGYFGDPWQQIYDDRTGDFAPPEGGLTVTKTENFRSAPEIVQLLNAFREDVEQVPAGENKDVQGSVSIRLVQAESPEGSRGRYTDEQLKTALTKFDTALQGWEWDNRTDVIRLFLVRQMIARRLNFHSLNQLFTGASASLRAQDDFEKGEHYLLKPFVQVIYPLLSSYQENKQRAVLDLLRKYSPFYDIHGANAAHSLKEMIECSKNHLEKLLDVWGHATVRDVLLFCQDNSLIYVSDRLRDELAREPHEEEFDPAEHGEDKGEWLADELFKMPTNELPNYCDFVLNNTPYSTQHGVKGEEFDDVLVVYDDVEAAWSNYNFLKLLAPQSSGEPTDGQRERGRKLAYVSFSRARQNLRILLFTLNPEEVRAELLNRGLFREDQIELA